VPGGRVPGLEVTLKVELPVGCGMGASAAVSLAVLLAGSAALDLQFSGDRLYDEAVRTERFIHGRSSGVDPFACLHGGMWRFQSGQASPAALPASSFFAVHSGVPACSTGECVAAVAARAPRPSVWEAFAGVTRAFEAALTAGDRAAVRDAVRRNHRLLCGLGVVPARVEAFIAAVEASGGAAKVSGAGAVRGETGGMILVFSEEAPAALCRDFGYRALALQPTGQGVRLLGDRLLGDKEPAAGCRREATAYGGR
jgi:mevalonate kinase